MTNQFFYTRKEDDGKEFTDSFNINKVIRSRQENNGSLLVLIDDLHERPFEIPIINPKTKKETGGVTRRREVVQTEVLLHGDDITRFKQLTEIK
jgi:hypothetical protein